MAFGTINDVDNGDKDIAKMHNERNALSERARTGHSKRPRIKFLETDEGGTKKSCNVGTPLFILNKESAEETVASRGVKKANKYLLYLRGHRHCPPSVWGFPHFIG